ncbi:hypothetical protein NSK_005658 [Nannochloropsis salina CCMP1776]|uniref:Cupin-like domain-containing protein n=1 Tax=Nannochloropsis salina CCMP1776 TaxID=1027361 RepID=A0A4D9CZI1_9STRA|nr:hypothetical protein NSK_005658 [Nannochloropsis salina CCMP1776]|eukprot:TFJ83033.1 hypothetical protein NSK_005658 [Nannochloropsis salina CCMP1776]
MQSVEDLERMEEEFNLQQQQQPLVSCSVEGGKMKKGNDAIERGGTASGTHEGRGGRAHEEEETGCKKRGEDTEMSSAIFSVPDTVAIMPTGETEQESFPPPGARVFRKRGRPSGSGRGQTLGRKPDKGWEGGGGGGRDARGGSVTGKGGQGDDEEGPGGGSTGNPPKKRGRKRLKPHPDVLAPVVTVAGGKDLYALRPPGNILRQMEKEEGKEGGKEDRRERGKKERKKMDETLYATYAVEGYYSDFPPSLPAGLFLHLIQGSLLCLLLPPTPTNALIHKHWSTSASKEELFLPLFGVGQSSPQDEYEMTPCVHKVELKEGETLLLPARWAIALFCEKESVFIEGKWGGEAVDEKEEEKEGR